MRRPGFAILYFDEESSKVSVEHLSHVDNKKNGKSHGEMLSEIFDELNSVLLKALALSSQHGSGFIEVRERGFSRFAAETQTLYKVVGISDYIAYKSGHLFQEISPMTIKKLVVGNAKAKKEDVAAA